MPALNDAPAWWAGALTDDFTLKLAVGLAFGMAALIVALRAWWRLHQHQRPRPHTLVRGEQGTATVEFVLVFPIVLSLVLILLQTTLVMAGNLFVHYAAFAATRSAITYIPADKPNGLGEPRNVIVPSPGTPKYEAIRRAAVFAVLPVCGELTQEQFNNAEPDVVDTAGFVAGLNDFYEANGQAPPKWIQTKAAGRLRYAYAHLHTTVTLLQAEVNGDDVTFQPLSENQTHVFGPRDPITVEVHHRLNLSIPYARAIFADAHHKYRSGAMMMVTAHYTLTNEGVDPAFPLEPKLPRRDRWQRHAAVAMNCNRETFRLGIGRVCRNKKSHRPDYGRSSHRRGVVLIITLLALVFLASLVFYVFNLGHATQSRIETQNAADAAANAGAGWVARSMNTVAMNNVAMTRQLAMVNALDSLPKSVAFTLEDQQAMLEATRGQLARGTGPELQVRDDLKMIEQELTGQVQMLEEVDDLFNDSSFDMRAITYYNAPGGERGQLWQAMIALDELNQATVEVMGPIAQTAAVRAAEVNLYQAKQSDDQAQSRDDALSGTGMLVPGLPQIAWKRGSFQDFEPPLLRGMTRQAEDTAFTDDWLKYRGPFDTVFGWHYVPPKYGKAPPNYPRIQDFGSSWSNGGQRSAPIIGHQPYYLTYGMNSWIITHFDWLNFIPNGAINANPLGSEGPLHHSGFHRHFRRLANIKLKYLTGDLVTEQVIDPRWITSYTDAQRIKQAEEPKIQEYRFIELRDVQIMTPDGSQPMQLESWSINIRPDIKPPGLAKMQDYMWRDVQIENIPNRDLDGDGVKEQLLLRRVHYYIFGGANVGTKVDVGNPYNAANPKELPAPIDFDHDVMCPDDQRDGSI